jgi:hypothetical protein
LRVEDWTDTRETLHMWLQIVGKLRLKHAPLLNHWWQVTLYVSPRGLTTSLIPYSAEGLEIQFDFIDHQLLIRTTTGATQRIALQAMPVAEFHARILRVLDELGVEAHIQPHPNEVEPAIPFAEDHEHTSYDPQAANIFWRQLLQANRVMGYFRAFFLGKSSTVHFFWGAMDLACTRFSGRPAPPHPGGAPNLGDWVMVEAYSRELSSCGFWPGGEEGAFYAYAYPEPDGFAEHPVHPPQAYYSRDEGEFLLPYEVVRTADDPDRTLLAFLQTSYEAAAEHGGWDRSLLEGHPDRWSQHQ